MIPLNVLAVDDSMTARAVLRKALGVAGLPIGRFLEAGDGRAALSVLDDEPVDVVFADLHMPVMDGMELVLHMQCDPALCAIPVVVVTSEGSVERVDAFRAAGVCGVLRKPCEPADLRDLVTATLGPRTGALA